MRTPSCVLTVAVSAVTIASIVRAEPIPKPTSTGPGCWSWEYDPTKPIPEDAKVVPGTCATPDGRCYVVPESGCFELTGVEGPLFDERPPPPVVLLTPAAAPVNPPNDPHLPVALRPTHPSGAHVPLPLPGPDGCSAGTGWDFETFLDNKVVDLPPLGPQVVVRGYASFDRWEGGDYPGVSPFVDLKNVDVSWKAAPVYGNAVPIQRIRPPGFRPDIEARIGGDYWRFSQDINQSGDFWIGSLDRRYSWKHHPGEDRDTWGESARGTLTSPPCTLRARYLSFRLGGTAHGSQRIEVHVDGADPAQYFGVRLRNGPGDPRLGGAMGHPTQYASPSAPQDFPPPTDPQGWVVVRSAMPDSGLDSDWMEIFVFDLAPFYGRTVRIRIVDDRRDQCRSWPSWPWCSEHEPEHLNADDFRFLDAPPAGTEWMRHSDGLCGGVRDTGDGCSPVGRVPSEPPLWGVTDVHAHPMANLAFGGHVFWGDAADSLDDIYDCSRPLPAIPGPGGRPAISPSHRRISCYLHGSVIAIATGVLIGGCQVLNVVPFVGAGLAAVCTATVTAAAAIASNVPVLSGATIHGASKISSGAVKLGVLFSSLLDILPEIELDFSTGLIPQTDSFAKATGAEVGGWWKKDEEWHSPTGIGKSHNAYQADMIRRAFHGGMRLGVWDVVNSRAFALVADGAMYSDWAALKDGTDAAKRIVATRLGDIATIVYSPVEAERMIRAGRMAIILGSEVDELGRMRRQGLPWPRSPHVGPDSMQKQADDLWELGIRKVTPVHATNNPIGGAALFYTKYDANNFFLSGTKPDQPPTFLDMPGVKLILDSSFGMLFKDLVLGEFSLIHDPVEPGAPPWNPTDWFDFDTTPGRSDDSYVGDYGRVTYRIGSDSFHDPSMKSANGWLPPSQVLGKQLPLAKLIKGGAFATTGPTCDLRDTTMPDFADSFGPTVDAHYTAASGHRNVLGLFRADGDDDGEGFLRALMKKGMLIDTDHLSQNMRVDVYRLAQSYAMEAGWPAGRCREADGRCGVCGSEGGIPCGSYPTVGVHSKVRGLEIDPKSFTELRNAYGYNDEASRSEREVRLVAENGGAFAVFPTGSAIIPPNTVRCTKDSDCASYKGYGSGVCVLQAGGGRTCKDVSANVVKRDFALPPEVENDCDASSKTFAVKYLWLMGVTGGRGLTPATDLNGLISTLKPRYGTSAPWNQACSGAERDVTDQGRPRPDQGWHDLMIGAQAAQASGVWYEDYAARGPVPSAAGMLWGDPRYKYVVARGAAEAREDRAPRTPVDDVVFFNDFGPDNALHRGYTYQEGNRPGAQMYPMKRWQEIAGWAGWDFNLDGLQHIGLYPDLYQDVRNVGVQWEQLGPLFHSARDYIDTWRKAVAIGDVHP